MDKLATFGVGLNSHSFSFDVQDDEGQVDIDNLLIPTARTWITLDLIRSPQDNIMPLHLHPLLQLGGSFEASNVSRGGTVQIIDDDFDEPFAEDYSMFQSDSLADISLLQGSAYLRYGLYVHTNTQRGREFNIGAYVHTGGSFGKLSVAASETLITDFEDHVNDQASYQALSATEKQLADEAVGELSTKLVGGAEIPLISYDIGWGVQIDNAHHRGIDLSWNLKTYPVAELEGWQVSTSLYQRF